MKKLLLLFLVLLISASASAQAWKTYYFMPDSTSNLDVNIAAKNLIYLQSDSSWYFLNHLARDTNKMSEIITWGWAYKVSGPADPILELWLRDGNYLYPANEDDTIYAKQLVLNGLSEDESPDSVISIVGGVLKIAALEEIPNYWSREEYGEGGVFQIYPSEETDFLKIPSLFMDPVGDFDGTIRWGSPGYPQTRLGTESYIFGITHQGILPNNLMELFLDTAIYSLSLGNTALLGGSQYLEGHETFRVEGKNSVFNPITLAEYYLEADSTFPQMYWTTSNSLNDWYKQLVFDSTGLFVNTGDGSDPVNLYNLDTIKANQYWFPMEMTEHGFIWQYPINPNIYTFLMSTDQDMRVGFQGVNSYGGIKLDSFSITMDIRGQTHIYAEEYGGQRTTAISAAAYNSEDVIVHGASITANADTIFSNGLPSVAMTVTFPGGGSKGIALDSTALAPTSAVSINLGKVGLPFDTARVNKLYTADTLGIVIPSANGTLFRIRVSNAGEISAQPL